MCEEKNKAIDKIKDYVPTTQTWGRAIVAAIPVIGGSLDHLLFDKAGEIRLQRLEESVKSIEEFISKIDKKRIDNNWYDNVEALDMFKQLYGKIEFEPSDSKVKALSQIYTLFGTKEHASDPNKQAILETISKLTDNQRIIFKAVGEVPVERKTGSGKAITYTASAIWQSSVLKYLNSNLRYLAQLKGATNIIQLNVELDILASFNLLRNQDVPNLNDKGYVFTGLGKLALSYLNEIA